MISKIKLTVIFSMFLFTSFSQTSFIEKNINENALFYAHKISKGSMVQENAVGIAGIKPRQSFYYDSLVYYSSEQELVELTNYPDAKVRCYAFDGLLSLGYKNIATVIRKNEKDVEKIQYQSGCIVFSQTVISYMLSSFTSKQRVYISDEDRQYLLDLKSRSTSF